MPASAERLAVVVLAETPTSSACFTGLTGCGVVWCVGQSAAPALAWAGLPAGDCCTLPSRLRHTVHYSLCLPPLPPPPPPPPRLQDTLTTILQEGFDHRVSNMHGALGG